MRAQSIAGPGLTSRGWWATGTSLLSLPCVFLAILGASFATMMAFFVVFLHFGVAAYYEYGLSW